MKNNPYGYSNLLVATAMVAVLGLSINFNNEPVVYGNSAEIEVGTASVERPTSTADLYKHTRKVYDERIGEIVNTGDDLAALRSNLYFEATNQIRKYGYDVAKDEMIWIAFVTLKRSYMFNNNSVADAVLRVKYDKNGKIIKNTAHYSWMADGQDVKKIRKDNASQDAYWLSHEVAEGVLSGKIKDPTKGHDHYCTLKVEKTTKWVKDMKKDSRVIIGDHVFFASPYKMTREKKENENKVTGTKTASI
jgi:hypothetical protein